MTKTPRTDAANFELVLNPSSACLRVVPVDFARELEVELIAAKTELDNAWNEIFAVHLTNVFCLPLSKAIAQELDGLLHQIRSSQTFLNEASAELSAAQERILFLENRLAESKPALVDENELN
ncbi:hypothetical protein [Janthinobacterium sp. CAN_S7]|uniref:hypothetical protein n=1 Tax=Janthinobacterium sp. CAN_S7 TaxID=3071704 RepID=UPI00319E5B75